MNDIIDENAETVVFTLVDGTGFDIGNPSFTVTIEDNDIPTIGFNQLYTQVREGSSESIILTLSTPVVTDQYIRIGITESKKVEYGKDYTTTPEPVNHEINLFVSAGSDEVSIDIEALIDKHNDHLELLYLQIAETTSGLTASDLRATVVGLENTKKKPVFTGSPASTKSPS